MVVEEYRRLAATLHDLQVAHGTKTLMVASALPREGKTLTVTNLAITLSESFGRRVLLIDADLRRPSVHGLLRLPNARGLSEGLRSDGRQLSLLEVSQTLSVMTAGRPGPQPLAGLTSVRMRTLLEEAATAFEWVLLDSPPVGIMPDANVLAGLTDGVILVIAAGSTPCPLIERAVNEIGRDHIVGTVLNRAEERSHPAVAYYHHYYSETSAE
jgi:capsular exopolysaccharide synthesis family protein